MVGRYDAISAGGIDAEKDMAREAWSKFRKEQSVGKRKAYAASLRIKYLDDGLDIKVHTEGREATTLVLEYALFGDVWERRMSKGTLLRELRDLGFKELHMSDGWRWSGGFKLSRQ